MPPKGNQKKHKTNGNATKNPPRKHKKQNTKQKRKLLPPKTENPAK
jgi:hypothetical protein